MNEPTNPTAATLSADPAASELMDHTTLRSRAIAGAFWTLGSYGLSQSFRLVSNIILAHLLFPEAFGLMALVQVVMQGLGMFSDMGIAPSIIQHQRGDEPSFLNTAWTVQVIRGVLLWIGACVLAWPASLFYHEPILAYMLPVAGFSAVFQGFNATSLYTMNRHLRLKQLALIDLGSQLLSIAVMIALASIWPSVWALVTGWLLGALSKMVLSHLLERHIRNRFAMEREALLDLIKFGKWIFASTLLTFLALQGDRIVLGRILTTADFGLYSIALILTLLSLHVANRIMIRVLFPVLSKHKMNPDRMMSLFIRSRRLVLLSGIATCGGIGIAAPDFFKLFYDERYHAAGPIAQWLVVYIWGALLVSGMSQVRLAMGESKVMFYSNLYRFSGIFLAVAGYQFGGLPYFILGMAGGVLLAYLYLFIRLPVQRAAVMRQSISYSLILAAYILLGQALVRAAGAIWTDTVVSVCSLALAGLGAAIIGVMLLFALSGRKLSFGWRGTAEEKAANLDDLM